LYSQFAVVLLPGRGDGTLIDEERHELPAGWAWTTLGESCEVVLGQSPPSKTYNTEGEGLPFFQGKAEFGTLYPTPVKWCSKPKKIAEADDVLISVRAPVGPTNLCKERSCIGRGLAALRPKAGADSHYILYFLRYIEKDWDRKATGTTFKAITGTILRSQEIPLAPLAQQHRIVAEIEKQLTRLDAGLAALKRAQANLRRYKAAVLKAACEGRLVPTEAELARAEGRDYEPASQLLQRILAERRAKWEAANPGKRYKEPAPPDTEGLPALPERWTIASMDQLTTLITSGPRHWSKYYGEGTGTFLMAQNVQPGKLDLSHRQPVNPPVDDSSRERSQVEKGDLLVTIVGANTGDVCRVPQELPEHYVCQSVALMRPVDVELSGFVTLYLTSPENGQRQYGAYIYGAGRPHLNFEQLRMTAVLLPPLAEQHRIVAEVERRLSVVQELEAAVEASLKRAERLRQAILKRAFEGKLVPQDPADEPAGVLLERIRAERVDGKASKKKGEQLRLGGM
jgi:type I restriction enzyme S subunit